MAQRRELYEFPRSENGAIRYGNIEGVGWISPTRIVTVSDRRKKKTQPDKGLSEKDQSIHVFEFPYRLSLTSELRVADVNREKTGRCAAAFLYIFWTRSREKTERHASPLSIDLLRRAT